MKRAAGSLAVLALLLVTARGAAAQTGPPTDPSASGPEQGAPTRAGAAAGASERAKPGLGGVPAMESTTLSGPIDPDVYRVGPGDLLLLQLWGKVSRNLTLEVGPEGMVLVPGARSLDVAGMTLREVREAVLGLLRDQFRGVNMDVRLARPRVFRIYFTGQVSNPGPATATGSSRIADVLTPGAVLPNASMRRIEVLHHDGQRELADLGLFLATGETTLNPWLRDGDVITVPVATEFVHVQGAVARPGEFELGPRDSLLTLLRLAGDPIPAAYVDRALLIRWNDALTPDSLWVNLEDVYSRRVNPPLQEGQRLYVYFLSQYHAQDEASIVGEVNQPGTFPITAGRTRLSELVGAARGFLPTADLKSIRVHRLSQNAGESDPELDRLLRLSRSEQTNTEYAVLRTKLASLRADYRVDWNRVREDPEHLDLLLRGGDTVRVERLVLSIRVDGEVLRPGIMSFKAGQSWLDYVAQAGGFTDRASVGHARVTRAASGQTLPAGSVRALNPGDFVWVPEKSDVSAWQHVQSVLASLAYIATIMIAIRTLR